MNDIIRIRVTLFDPEDLFNNPECLNTVGTVKETVEDLRNILNKTEIESVTGRTYHPEDVYYMVEQIRDEMEPFSIEHPDDRRELIISVEEVADDV